MKKKQIAITIRSFDKGADYFKTLQDSFEIGYINNTGSRLEKSDISKAINNCDGVIAGTEIFDAEILASAPSLKVISRVGVGTDTIDVNFARMNNIRIFNTPDAPVKAVAEHTLALILSLLKHIPHYNQNVKMGNQTVKTGELIAGKTIGIIGLGRIGFQVARALSCLGSKIIFFDPFLSRTTGIPEEWIRMDSLESVLSTADVITFHATPPKDNKPLMSKEEFSFCKKGIMIINTARESLIDEEALVAAINEGIVGGIALDVFDKKNISKLNDATNEVILTPHIASNTRSSRRDMESEAVNNLILGLREVL